MGFKLGDIVIDRIQYGWAETFDNNDSPRILYTLSQLADGTIDISAESKDAVDAQGTLIKRFWQGKTGTFTANNAMLNLNILQAKSGVEAEMATSGNTVLMPKFFTVPATQASVDLSGYDADQKASIRVCGLANNGAQGATYTLGASAASATEFYVDATGKLTLPTNTTEDNFAIKYMRKCEDGAKITNYADKMPNSCQLYLKCLAVDPCSADTLKALYVHLPSFQPSPETSIGLTTDGQLEFSGDLQVAYCGGDGKVLYNIFWADDDSEE